MSIRCVDSKHQANPISLPLDGSTAITANTVLAVDLSNKVLVSATSSVGTTLTARYIAFESVDSGATSVLAYPIDYNQQYEFDCNANTATTQLCIRHALTDAATLNNTTTDVATTLGLFLGEELVGAAADKKMRGRFLLPGQVTA